MSKRFLICAFVLAGFARLSPAQPAAPYSPVTDARLVNPEPENWLMYRRTYNGWGYSPLDQITSENVKRLTVAWTLSTGALEGHQSPPIVNDGRMFVTTPQNQVLALDAVTGDLLWRYRYELPADLQQLHPTNRGVALYGDKLYFGTVDAHVVALDAASGEVVWDRAVGDYKVGYYITLAPLAVKGKVMVGASGGELGIRGFVAALDAETGEEAWKTYTIPGPGEPGNETWPAEAWRTGGASVWLTGNYDPNLNLTYWGIGNGGPWIGDARPGDNLYTNSVIALDADTGQLKGYHQYHPNGSWDWDEVDPPMLIDLQHDGNVVPALVHAGRNGYIWFLERRADRIGFLDATQFVYQNAFTAIDPTTGRPTYDPAHKPATGQRLSYCPSLSGGKNWPPAAYNPGTKLLYIPANENLCTIMEGSEAAYEPGRRFTGAQYEWEIRDGDHIGELQAWNLETRKKVWSREFESQNWGPVLTTGGGLVFMGGTNDRFFRAFDASSGEHLWQVRTNSGVTGVPTSFSVDGKQYIAVQSGWGVDAQRMQGGIDRFRRQRTDVPQGGVIWVFALPE